MYTCSCKAAKVLGGTSDEIFNHCIKPKRHKNFLRKQNPKDGRIDGLSSADCLKKSMVAMKREITPSSVLSRDYNKYIETGRMTGQRRKSSWGWSDFLAILIWNL